MASPVLKSIAVPSSGYTTTITGQIQVNAGDLVLVQTALNPVTVDISSGVYGCLGSGNCSYLTSVVGTSPNMTFQSRMGNKMAIYPSPSGDAIWVWMDWAIAPSSGLSTITATIAGAGPGAWCMNAMTVDGTLIANPSNPWSVNASLPSLDYDNDCNLTDGCGVVFSTTEQNTLVVFGVGAQGNPNCVPPSGYTLSSQTFVPSWMSSALCWATYSTPQTNVSTGSWVLENPQTGVPQGESASWYSDAIVLGTPVVSPPSPPPSPPSPPPGGPPPPPTVTPSTLTLTAQVTG